MIATTAQWFLPVIMGSALADSINPCAFSILFLTIAFLLSLGKDRAFILKSGAMYIFGIALVHTLIGVGMLQVLSFFHVPNGLAKIGAIILILYTVISLINEFFPAFPLKLKIPTDTHAILGKVINKASIPASLFLGILVGMFEFPCTGGPYLFVLSLLHDNTQFWAGFGYLILYNIIFVSPLIVMLLLSANKTVLEKIDALRKTKTKKMRIALDVTLLVIGIIIYLL